MEFHSLRDAKNYHYVHTARYLRLCRTKSSTSSRSPPLESTLILSCHIRLNVPRVFFFYQNTVWISIFLYTYYMPCSSHLPLKSGNSTAQMDIGVRTTLVPNVYSTGIGALDLPNNAPPIVILQDCQCVWMSKWSSLQPTSSCRGAPPPPHTHTTAFRINPLTPNDL
jgi:hypothetical protein